MIIYGKYLKRILRFINYLEAKTQRRVNVNEYELDDDAISPELKDNQSILRNTLGKSSDTVFREFNIGNKRKTKSFICFISGLADKNKIDQHIIKALMIDAQKIVKEKTIAPQNTFNLVKTSLISTSEVKETSSFCEIIKGILSGDAALFINGYATALLINLRSWEQRSITEPLIESTIRGPREGFTETLGVNLSMLRRKIKNPNLIIEQYTYGRQTRTDICLAYLNGIASSSILAEIRCRLKRIETDAILESGYIEQFIEDNPFSPFATIGNTEKPDIVAAKLLEGRIAIFCDGTPFVLTIPYLFMEALQSPEDYYSRPYFASFIRLLRYFSFFITVVVPSLYVALETFHQELIPTVLLITAAASKEGIPFPAFLETLIVVIIFELLREAGVRMPQPVGQATSIVGALIIGESAVQAGILSAPAVIIGALIGITSFIITPVTDAAVLFRFFLLILSATFGLYGITIGVIVILGHMCSLRSFGTPYLAPFAPMNVTGLKDSLMRAPLWLMHARPKSITWENSKRQDISQMPSPPEKDGKGR